MSEYQYKRVLLKISGEALMGNADYGIDPNVVERMAVQVKQLQTRGSRSRSLSEAATSSAVSPALPRVWSAPRPITWACLPRL